MKVKLTTKTKTIAEPYFACDRCEITSDTERRMCPCPRGGCEAKVVATKVITTITTFIPKNEKKRTVRTRSSSSRK